MAIKKIDEMVETFENKSKCVLVCICGVCVCFGIIEKPFNHIYGFLLTALHYTATLVCHVSSAHPAPTPTSVPLCICALCICVYMR